MSSMPPTKEFLFINECGKKQQSKTSPPKDLEIEFPPTFDFNELGDKFKNGKGKKKPPNAFILFRTKYNEALHRRGQFSPMKVVSGWARDAWNLLPLYQKQEYERFATRAASLYQEWALHSPANHSQNNRNRNKRIRTANGYDATTTTNRPSSMPIQEPPQSPPLLASPASPLSADESNNEAESPILQNLTGTYQAGIFQPVLIPVESVPYELNANIYNNFFFYNIDGDFGIFNPVNYDPDLLYDVNDYPDVLSELSD
ncbi:146_t:CDS:1 [Dentiscutata heterogama]|uniref:146_t:CDS:1 n=1 Tax=Dentiscutata heterogama TaxID=1316150 RepID=A0ACA9MQZ8_9GLOM|nr:146_t:CDS:1 [Dentiscutata heterogama]